MGEIVQYGALPAVLLVTYSLIDKVIVPMIGKVRNGSNGSSGSYDYRLRMLEDDVRGIRRDVNQINTKVGVAQAILERIEKSIQ